MFHLKVKCFKLGWELKERKILINVFLDCHFKWHVEAVSCFCKGKSSLLVFCCFVTLLKISWHSEVLNWKPGLRSCSLAFREPHASLLKGSVGTAGFLFPSPSPGLSNLVCLHCPSMDYLPMLPLIPTLIYCKHLCGQCCGFHCFDTYGNQLSNLRLCTRSDKGLFNL